MAKIYSNLEILIPESRLISYSFYAMLRNLNFTFKAMGQEGFQAGEWHGQFAF